MRSFRPRAPTSGRSTFQTFLSNYNLSTSTFPSILLFPFVAFRYCPLSPRLAEVKVTVVPAAMTIPEAGIAGGIAAAEHDVNRAGIFGAEVHAVLDVEVIGGNGGGGRDG